MLNVWLRSRKQNQIDRRKKAIDLASCNNNTLVDSAVTVNTINTESEDEWQQHTPLSECNTLYQRL